MHRASSNSGILEWTPVLSDNTLNILVIYDSEKEKIKLAESLMRTKDEMKIKVYWAKSLPLLEMEIRTRFNYIIFLIDFTRRYCFKVFEEAVRHIDINFLMGRSLIICINMLQMDKACYSYDHIRDIQNIYQTRVIHGDFTTTQGMNYMTDAIMSCINKACLKV